jgi:uncharacterized protein
MLLIPVRLDRSTIHGLGVFAVDLVREGTLIWRFTPGFDLDLDPRVLDEQPPHFRQVMLHYGYIDRRLSRFILCCDNYRFVNHSDAPNVRTDLSLDRYGSDFASRDIQAGEEITVNYSLIEVAGPS